MSNEIEQIIEDVEENELIESEVEVSEETEVTEQEQPLSNAVLDVLLGEAKKKNEAEHEDDDAEVEEDEDEELEEAKVSEEDEEDEVEEEDDEELEEGAHEDEDEEEVEEGEHSDEDEVEEESDEDEKEELPEVQTKAGYLAASYDAIKGMKKSELVAAYKAVNMSEEEDEVEVPTTKADIINAMYGQLKAMKKDDLMASYKMIKSSHCESVKEETEADLFADDLKVLASADQELTEDFKQKASILFEAAVANKVQTIQEQLEEEYAADLQEEVTYVRESLVTKIDDYLSYVVESWIEENQEFVDNKLRTEITENFMSALQNVFTEHYIEVPDSKVDLVDQLAEEAAEVKAELKETVAERAELAKQVETLQREKILSEASADLASTQAEKLSSLVEETEFVDADTFAAKVATIKEGFFKESTETKDVITETVDSATTETKTIVEGEVSEEAKLPRDMAKYVSHLSRFK
jgi:cell division protein FtsB